MNPRQKDYDSSALPLSYTAELDGEVRENRGGVKSKTLKRAGGLSSVPGAGPVDFFGEFIFLRG